MSGLPKYNKLVCNTYNFLFVAGDEQCTLNAGSETRSRLLAGGTLFRSIDVGTINDEIKLECIVTPGAGDVEDVVFKITHPNEVITTLTFTQEYDSVGESCVENGFNRFRAELDASAASSLIEIPSLDVQTPGTGVGGAWDITLDEAECLFTSFGPTPMVGGSSPPTPTPATIRTGPVYSLYYIRSSEEGRADGSLIDVSKIVEYDGDNWINFPSHLYPAGSGSPALCGI